MSVEPIARTAHYWILDPDVPSVLALDVGTDGSYVEAAQVSGGDTLGVAEPFAVEFAPTSLVAD